MSWENPKHTLGAMVAFFSITLLLSSPPCSLLLFLPSLLALALLASALSPFLPAPLPSPASVRLLGSRSLDVLSLTACLVFDLLLDATSGASPSLTFSAATLAWGLSTLGGYISLSAFTLASIALLFSMAPVAAVASHGLSKVSSSTLLCLLAQARPPIRPRWPLTLSSHHTIPRSIGSTAHSSSRPLHPPPHTLNLFPRLKTHNLLPHLSTHNLLLRQAAPVTAAVSELPPAARFMVSAAASVAGAYAGFTGDDPPSQILPPSNAPLIPSGITDGEPRPPTMPP